MEGYAQNTLFSIRRTTPELLLFRLVTSAPLWRMAHLCPLARLPAVLQDCTGVPE